MGRSALFLTRVFTWRSCLLSQHPEIAADLRDEQRKRIARTQFLLHLAIEGNGIVNSGMPMSVHKQDRQFPLGIG